MSARRQRLPLRNQATNEPNGVVINQVLVSFGEPEDTRRVVALRFRKTTLTRAAHLSATVRPLCG